METQANYTLIGGFVLLFLVAIITFIIWMSHSGLKSDMEPYEIHFTGSVSGLNEGSAVRYRGVAVGTVTRLSLDPEDLERVRVKVLINRKVPIKQDVQASLELQGITGGAYIQLEGGTRESPIRVAESGQRYPLIPSRFSRLEEVADSFPHLLQQANALVTEVRQVFSADNQQAITQTLANIQEVSHLLVKPTDKGDNVISQLHKSTVQLKTSFQELEKVAAEIRQILQENRGSLKDFTTSGLTSLTKFLAEASETIHTFRRIGDSLERSPSRFLHNDPHQGRRVP